MSYDTEELARGILDEFSSFHDERGPVELFATGGFRVCYDPVKAAKCQLVWQALHPAAVADFRRKTEKWRKDNPEKMRASYRRVREKIKTAGPNWEPSRIRAGKPFRDQHGNVYLSHSHAAARCGMTRTSVNSVLRGRLPAAKGYVFTYIEKELIK